MLRSLELFGFKSFADRTSFEFDPGITCVVGPNGSGKSNVVDAIKWILGDQSAKSLRGSEMLDVVFNGSTARQPAALAEAIITFDNVEQADGSRLFERPDDRVAVGRRLYRSGESEYLINGQAVRLKDVRDLFLTGQAGTAAYSIIEQGRVDQILNANAAARRAVFEEAAGVSKFKAKRKEAQRRLDTVEQNLTRLTDIVDELDTRLSATRSQASKAARYRDLTRELRTRWIGLAADQTAWLDDTLAAAGHDLEAAAARRDELDAQLASEAARQEELSETLAAAERELAAAMRQRAASREQQAELRSTLRALAAQRDTLDEEQAQRRQAWRAAVDAAAASEAAIDEAAAQVGQVQDKLAAHVDAQSALQTIVDRTAADAADAKAWADELAELAAVSQGEIDDAAAALGEQKSQRAAIARRRDQVTKRIDTLTAQADAAAIEVAQKRTELTAAETARGSVQDELTDTRRRRAEVAGQLAAVEASIVADGQEQTAAQARQTVLRDLQQRGDGLGVGVREIVARAGQMRAQPDSGGAPWNTIYGLAGELLDCSVDDAPLLDLALGPRSQLVVTSDLAAVVAYLDVGPPLGGRVGFVELPSDDGDTQPAPQAGGVFGELQTFYAAQTPDLSDQPGVRRRADALITPGRPGQARLAARLLRDTWIVDRLSTARRLHDRFPTARLLTLAGELVDADGSLHVGPAAPETAVLERRSELRSLASLIARLDRRLVDADRRRESLRFGVETLDTELAELERSQPDAHRRAGQARSTVESLQSKLDRMRQELTELADEADALDDEEAAIDRTADDLGQSRAQRENELASVNRQRAEARRQLDEAAATQSDLAAQRQELTVTQAQLEERLSAAESSLTRLQSECEAAAAAVIQAADALAATEARRSAATLAWLNTRAMRDESLWNESGRDDQLRTLRHTRDRCRLEVETLRAAGDEVRRERQAAADQAGRSELAIREATRDRDQLAAAITEEYDLTLDDLLAVAANERLSAYAARIEGLAEAEQPAFEEVRDELEAEVQRIRRKIRALGSVNTDALADLDELEQRHEELAAHLLDLREAKVQLEAIIVRMGEESQRMFLETFEAIRGHFQQLFRQLFGGGQADLVLEEADDILECGLEIVARPPGKELRGLSLLSGGEKTMTAVGLLLAMFRAKPSPYCLLDEVDAALDEGNIGRFVDTVAQFREETQFIIITHRKRTMVAADVLYGVTMETAGVSKRMSVHLEEVADDGAIRRAA